jgi:ribosomal subunit interface protein
MNLELVCKDVTPTELLRERIEQKLLKLEGRLDQKLQVRVSLTQDAGRFHVNVHFHAAKHEFNATADADEAVKAADEALARVERQVSKAIHKAEANRKPNASIRRATISGPPVDLQA